MPADGRLDLTRRLKG